MAAEISADTKIIESDGPENAKSIDDRPQKTTWKRRIDFLMTFFGMTIGLGNMWRFPYLCYKNGGGVFLVAYVSLLAVFVVPNIILELAMGQYTHCSAVKIWKLVPVMRGIGYAGYVMLIYSNIYYPVIMAWALRWMVAGVSADLPWMHCNNPWNEDGCIALATSESNFSQENYLNQTMLPPSNATRLSSVEEFWRNHIISISSGIEEIGDLKWELVLCLFVIWLLVYFSIWKGIGWTSKIVYVTATLPVVMIFVVLVRGVTLDGASDGIHDYLLPNITKLIEFEVWTDAANQVTFSFIVGYGCLATLSSHNKFNHNLLRDAVIVSFANGLASFAAGFAIFSVLGHMALVKNTTVAAVAESGPGLVFIAYPTALSLLPAPNFWMVLFFMTLILLGLDSMFVIQDGVFECTKDLLPWLFRHKWNHEIGHAVLGGIMFILGLSLVTEGGIYIFHIVNTYSVAGWCVFFSIFCESLAIGWIYRASRFCNNIQEMVKWKVPRIWLTASWKFVSPAITLLLMGYSLATSKNLTFDRTYPYPLWATILAWLSAFSSVICIPLTAAYVIRRSKGKSFLEKLKNSTKPAMSDESNKGEKELHALNDCKDDDISNS